MAHQSPVILDPAGRDIHGEAARLRRQGGAAVVQLPGGVTAWAVTSADLLRRLLRDPRVSRDAHQHWPTWISGQIPPDWPLHIWVSARNMLNSYGSDHKRLRSLVATGFTARRVAELRPRIEQITADLLDALAAGPPGEPVDLRERFAHRLPIEVICQLLGIPDHARPGLRRTIDGVVRTSSTPQEMLANQHELYTILNDLVAAKRNNPGDDMTSALIAACDEGGSRLTETELVDTLVLLIGAGHETTVNLMDQAIVALLTHPDQLDRVRAGDHSWDDVIDETLRWQGPAANLPLRFAVEDIQVDGVFIRRGEAILAGFAAAGRDPAQHGDDADRFDIGRPDKSHLAFGHGVHYCLGAPLARLEAGIALPALFTRFPALSLAVPPGELRHLESFISNGHREVPAVLHGGIL